MTSNGERKISSLRDLPLDIAPPRDLWQGIEGRIAAEPRAGKIRDSASVGMNDGSGARGQAQKRFGRAAPMRVLAAAAVIAALAVGIWIGRAVLPGPGTTTPGNQVASNTSPGGSRSAGESGNQLPGASGGDQSATDSGALGPEYFMDAKYIRQRAQLVKGLEARLAALPPGSREKVVRSLKAISDSKRELEAELGKDPSNALLQELLVNTYQDEMRVLTAVHEAGNTGEGI
jgi:hypothetical protein